MVAFLHFTMAQAKMSCSCALQSGVNNAPNDADGMHPAEPVSTTLWLLCSGATVRISKIFVVVLAPRATSPITAAFSEIPVIVKFSNFWASV